MQTWSPERNIAATLEAIEIAVARKSRRSGVAVEDTSAARTTPASPQKIRE
jgi:hypothetical protein